MNSKRIIFILKYILLLGLIYFPIFQHLASVPIQRWDESRLAANALEMLQNGNWIVTYFHGVPDMWNTKPPLLIWMQVFWMKILGVNELAMRMPSAIAAVLTCALLLFFSIKYLKKFWFGFIAILVLLTSEGYLRFHVVRTGDYDALLILMLTAHCLFYYLFLEQQSKNTLENTKPSNKYLHLSFLALTLAVLTKGIAGLMLSPPLLLFTIFQKQLIPILKNKFLYINIGLFLFFTLGYYLLREAYNPGYLAAVQENELGGRYLNTLEGHQADFWYYFNNMVKTNFKYWLILLPCAVAIGLVHRQQKLIRLTIFLTILTLFYGLIISFGQTKLEWYDAPLYPLLALLVTIFIYFIFEKLKHAPFLNQSLKYPVLPYLFLFLVFFLPYQTVFLKTYQPQVDDWNKNHSHITYFLKNAAKGHYDLNHTFLLYKDYNAENQFYLNILKGKGVIVDYKDWTKLEKEDTVFLSQPELKDFIKEHYTFTTLFTYNNVDLLKITDLKSNEE